MNPSCPFRGTHLELFLVVVHSYKARLYHDRSSSLANDTLTNINIYNIGEWWIPRGDAMDDGRELCDLL